MPKRLSIEQFKSKFLIGVKSSISFADESSFKNMDSACKFKCGDCGYEWSTKCRNIRDSVKGCHVCCKKTQGNPKKKNKVYRRECKEITKGGLKPIENYKGDNVEILHVCYCGNKRKVMPNSVLHMGIKSCVPCGMERTQKSNNSFNVSKSEVEWLKRIAKKLKIKIKGGDNKSQKRIRLNTGKTIIVDGFCKKTNTIFEFHGDCWHGNPYIYTKRSKPHPKSEATANKLYQDTMERMLELTKLGFNVIWVWEDHFNKGGLISGELKGYPVQ
ncbi:hypothetical protein GR11A_00005 [Vibrio phage vB_VcorM_GR11A]|nr:hypothetical protein GR11A_00005 [Vibrio phage vB_VcorM_GR11A]